MMTNVKYVSVITFLLELFFYANSYSSVIIVEDAKACYRRVLAGKRVLGRVVLRVVPCERLEDCQRECSEERRFDCETFNYRLDPSNRGKGLCELTSTPLAHLDLRKDFIEDRDYDFYELDRNSAPDCSISWPHWLEQSGVSGCPGCQGSSRPVNYGGKFNNRHDSYDRRWDNHGWIAYNSENRYGSNAESYRGGHRGGDFFHLKDWDRHRGKPYPAEIDKRWDRNFIPYDIAGGRKSHKNWGQYGGSYGYGGSHQSHHSSHDEHKSSYDYWGLDRNDYDKHYLPNNSLYPTRGVAHYGDYYGDKHKHDFNYFDLGHRDQGTKCCGGKKDSYWGDYGNSYGHNSHSSSSWSSSHEYEEQNHYNAGHDSWISDGIPVKPYDCSSRSGSGFRMSRGVVRKAFSVPDIYECEMLCFSEKHFECNSYSFRYSRNPSDNCFLSDRYYPTLDLYNDVQPDRDFDIYAMNDDRKYCEHFLEYRPSGPSGPGGPPGRPGRPDRPDRPDHPIRPDRPVRPGRFPDDRMESECFWRVRSGRRLSSGAVKIALVATGIAHCEAECLRSQDFTCRAFSFRYGPPVIGDILENCQLTDWPQVGRSHEGLVESPPCELYERGSYGHGCEPNPFALDSPNALGPVREPKKDELCYLQYDTSAKLLPEAVRIGTRLPTEHACKVHCSKLRESSRSRSISSDSVSFNCMSFSYTADPHLSPHKDNCLLSDIQLRDLQPALDYTQSKTHWLFAYNTFDPACSFGDRGPRPDHRYPGRPSGPGVQPPFPPSSSELAPPGYGPSGHGGPGRPVSRPDPSGHGEYAGLFGRPSDHGWNRRFDEDTWSVFTVSGWPCRRGTKCAPNPIAGYWSCELEGGEIGSWDYCCHPGHRCGHSKGFNYPWCYVGPSRSQWRPCSDRYYPYGHGSSSSPNHGLGWSRPPGYLPDTDRNDLPGRPHHRGRPYLPQGDRRHWHDIYKDGPISYYDEYNNPRPGYVRVPTIEKNRVKYHHNLGPERPSRPHWIPVRAPGRPEDDSGPGFLEPPRPGGFGAGRYWPVSYLHKEAPPNSTFYKSDKENGRNNIPNDDKRGFPDAGVNRRKDEPRSRFDDKNPDEKKGNGGTQTLSIDSFVDGSRNARDRDNNTANTNVSTDNNTDDDKLVLISSSNKNVESNDKQGRIVKGPDRSSDDRILSTGEKLDDKLERFTDDNVEIFTVDEPLRGKLNDKDTKANLERLLKEEKQIEEIGKTFKRRDDRTRVQVEKRSQDSYNPENGFKSAFQPEFIPVDIETRSQRVIDFDGSSRRSRAFSGFNEKSYSTDKPSNFNTKSTNENNGRDRNDSITNKPPFRDNSFKSTISTSSSVHQKTTNPFIEENRKVPTNFDISTKSYFNTSPKSEDRDKINPFKMSKVDSNTYDSVAFQTERGTPGKSVVNNGQIFYEVPPEESDGKRLLGHIEKVELKNYAVNVKVGKEKPNRRDDDGEQLELASSDFRRPQPNEYDRFIRYDVGNERPIPNINKGSDEYEAVGIDDGQFGTRTGHIKRVEVPFYRNNNTSRLVSRGRRNFRISYDPSIVRKRLLDRQKLESSKEI